MSLVVTEQGARVLLGRALNGYTPAFDDVEARLFKNDIDIEPTTVLADLQESTFAGYFRQQLEPADWSTPVTVAGRAESTYGTAPLEWIVTAGTETVFGVYLVDMATNFLIAAERLETPRVLDTDGKLQLTMTLNAMNADL